MRNNQLSTNNLAKSLFILPSKGFEEGSLPQKNVTRLKPLNMEPQQKYTFQFSYPKFILYTNGKNLEKAI